MVAPSGAHLRAPTYVVHAGDTLYSIAWRHDLDYRDLARWNRLDAGYRLAIGQVLVLAAPAATAQRRVERPAPGAGPPPRTPSAGPPSAGPPPSGSPPAGLPPVDAAPQVGKPLPLDDAATTSVPSPRSSATPAAVGAAKPPGGAARSESPAVVPGEEGARWVWPTDRESAPRPVPGGGILLFGRLGQDVRAARAGRVVYTGSGLRGYGNLVIIKHADSLLSSYAHNRELLVHEGQEVAAGQVIAHMGVGPHQVSALYFEIRVNGKPIDPMRYLGGLLR